MTKRCGGRRPRIGREGCTGHPGAAIPDFEGCGDFCLAMVLGDGDIFVTVTSGVPRNFVRGGRVQHIQLRRENGDLGAVAP